MRLDLKRQTRKTWQAKEKPSVRIKSIMRPRPNPCTVQEGLTDQDRNISTNLSAKRWQVCAAQIPPSAQMTSNLTLNCTFWCKVHEGQPIYAFATLSLSTFYGKCSLRSPYYVRVFSPPFWTVVVKSHFRWWMGPEYYLGGGMRCVGFHKTKREV